MYFKIYRKDLPHEIEKMLKKDQFLNINYKNKRTAFWLAFYWNYSH